MKVLWAITGLAVLALSAATVLLARQAGALERLRQQAAVRASAADERILFLAAAEGQETTDLWVVPARGGQATRLAENVEVHSFGQASPVSLISDGDERRLAFLQGPPEAMRLVTLDLDTGERGELFVASDGWWLASPSASPDGRRLAFISHEPPPDEEFSGDLSAALYVVNTSDGDIEQRLEPVPVWTPLAWSPDGQWLAANTGQARSPKLTLLPAAGGGPPQTLSFHAAWLAAWSPDGAWLTTAHWELGGGPKLVSWDVVAGREVDLPLHGTGPGVRPASVFNPAWSPDGTRLLYQAGMDSWSMGLYVVGREGGEPLELFAEAASTVWWACWSPDGEQVAFLVARGGGRDRSPLEMDGYVVQPDGQGLWQVDAGIEGRVQWMAWSPDGRRLAFALNGEGDELSPGQLYTVDLEERSPKVLHEGLRGYSYPLWLAATAGDE
ncbi:MAG: hypothetical protein QHJ81_07355 [Anaerolineae bacterium]|nr:hypothetical protein [Anaerolineae bacterium]